MKLVHAELRLAIGEKNWARVAIILSSHFSAPAIIEAYRKCPPKIVRRSPGNTWVFNGKDVVSVYIRANNREYRVDPWGIYSLDIPFGKSPDQFIVVYPE